MATVEAARLITVLETRGHRESLSALEQVGRAVDALKGNIAGGFAFAAGFAAFNAGVGALKAGFELATEAAFNFNSNIEQSTIAFTSMLGGARQATAFLAELRQLATDTSFSLPQVQQGAQRLLAMGFEVGKIPTLLKDIGAASIGLNAGAEGISRMTRALGQMRSSDRVLAEDMNQLIDVGVPAWDLLAKGIGKTTAETRKLAEAGKIPAAVFIDLFQAWSRGQFPGLIEGYAKTWEGATTKIKDLAGQMVGGAFQPLFEWATKLAVQFGTWLESPQAARWAAAVRAAVETVVGAFQALWTATQPVRDAFARFFDGFADLMGIPKALPAAKAAGGDLGKGLAEGMTAAITQGNPLDAAIKNLQIPLAGARIAAQDIKDAYSAAIDPLKEQAAALAPIVDFQAQLRDLQLDTEASALREKEARENILKASRSGITTRGTIQHGKDPTDALRLLGIQSEQQAAAAAGRLAEINRGIALAPILANIAALEAAQKEHLKPIEAQIKAQDRALALLQLEKQAVAEIGNLATNAGQAVAAITAPLTGDADSGAGEFGGRVFDVEAVKKRAGEIAGAFWEGFVKWFDENKGPMLSWAGGVAGTMWEGFSGWLAAQGTRLREVVTAAVSPDGIKAWETFRDGLLGAIDQKVKELQPGLRTISYEIAKSLIENAPNIARGFLYVLKEGMLLTLKATTWLGEIGFAIGEGIGIAIGQWLRGHIGDVIKFALMPPGTPLALLPFPSLPLPGGSPPSTPAAAETSINVTVGQVILKPDMTEAERVEAEKALGARVLKEILAAQQAAA